MTQKNQPKDIIDRGQLYDAYLQTPYLLSGGGLKWATPGRVKTGHYFN